MDHKEMDLNPRPRVISAVKITRSELESELQQTEVIQHCFYCNFTLECGQPICLWHDDTE